MLMSLLWACLSDPQYILPKDPNSQKLLDYEEGSSDGSVQHPMLADGPPPEPGNDGMGEQERRDPPIDEFADTDGACEPVASSLNRHPAVAKTGILVNTTLNIKEGRGAMLVEIVRHDPEKGSVAVFNISCNLAVSLKYYIPKDIGPVYAVYFADKVGDGPTQDDPMGISPVMDTTKEGPFSHIISLSKDNSIAPLQLPFLPIHEEKDEKQANPPDPVEDIPPPTAEPETGLPPPIIDQGEPPPLVPNIEEVSGEPEPQVRDLPPKDE